MKWHKTREKLDMEIDSVSILEDGKTNWKIWLKRNLIAGDKVSVAIIGT